MSAAGRREELEGAVWQSLGIRHKHPSGTWERSHVAAVLAFADAYAKEAATAAVRRAREAARPKPAPGEKAPPVVHWTLPGDSQGLTACRPGDWSSRRWLATDDPQEATCQSCRSKPAWQEAVRPRQPLALAAGGGEDP